MQVTNEEKEDDLPPNEEDKLAQWGEEARGKRAGHTAQKGNHLKWAASKCGLMQITKALRRPVLVSISPEVTKASIVPDSEEFSSCFVTRLSLPTPAIISSILLSSKTPLLNRLRSSRAFFHRLRPLIDRRWLNLAPRHKKTTHLQLSAPRVLSDLHLTKLSFLFNPYRPWLNLQPE